ncbi:MAG: hypothetical protein JNK05_20820 [Myxococcales bacterium]|nr:hypothetical protein [Myxococcales bacterium]
MSRSKALAARLALVSLLLVGCERARRVVHAATSDPGEHHATTGTAPLIGAAMPVVAPGAPTFVADTGVNITDVAAPNDALARAGKPLGPRFASLLVGGPNVAPVSITPVSSADVRYKRIERNTAASFALGVAGIASSSVEMQQGESSVLLSVTRIEQELEFAPPTEAAPGATYYIRKIKLGRAFFLALTGSTSAVQAIASAQSSNASLQAQLRTHSSELRIQTLARGLQPTTPVESAAQVSLDPINGYTVMGEAVPILVDYWSVPGTAQAAARSVRVEFSGRAVAVGTDPFNPRPRWTLLARCERNVQPVLPSDNEPDGRWFDGEVSRDSTITRNQSEFRGFSGAIAAGERLRCALGGFHHAGLLGKPALSSAEFSWRPGQSRARAITLQHGNRSVVAEVTVRVVDE